MIDLEDSRLRAFRQLKKLIRGSKEHLIVGIDVAKEKHHAFFGTPRGETLFKRLVFENTIEGFEKLLIRLDALKVQHALSQVVFGLEPTANYHKPLAEYLTKCGYLWCWWLESQSRTTVNCCTGAGTAMTQKIPLMWRTCSARVNVFFMNTRAWLYED